MFLAWLAKILTKYTQERSSYPYIYYNQENVLTVMWKKQSWPNLRYCSGIFVEELRKTMTHSVRIVNVLTLI